MQTAARILLALALPLAACSSLSGGPGPAPTRITPPGAYRGQAVEVRIEGAGLLVKGVHRLGAGVGVDDRYRAALGTRPLEAVQLRVEGGSAWLHAIVPADLAVGAHDLTLHDPFGVSGSLRAAFRVSDRAPPRLVASLDAPARAEAGQPAAARLVVANGGGEPAAIGAVSVGGAGVDLPPGASVDPGTPFTLPLAVDTSTPGVRLLAVAVAATDSVTGQPLAPIEASAQIAVLRAPAVEAALSALPGAINVGQSVELSATLVNAGEVDVLGLAPSVAAGPALSLAPPPGVDLAAGATATLRWTAVGAAPGDASPSLAWSGTDALTGRAVGGAARWPSIAVQRPAAPQVAGSLPAQASVGQALSLAVTIENRGQAALLRPAVTIACGAALAIEQAPALPASLSGAAQQTLTWTLRAVSAGTSACSIELAGDDANSGGRASAAQASPPCTVQLPAALSASMSAPASVATGSSFDVTLTVTNGGGATANGVAPAAPAMAGTGSATLASGPTPPAATIAGGANATFSWSFVAGKAGTLQLASSACGTDANDGAQRCSASSSASAAILGNEATILASDPFGSDGTTFAYLFSYQNKVYVGPNQSGAGAVRMNPDGSSPQVVNWLFEINRTVSPLMRNTLYQADPSLARTIGKVGTLQNVATAGPDNEAGPGVFLSGVVNGTEWYLLTGSMAVIGSPRYVYMTNPGYPKAADGSDRLAWVQIQAAQPASSRQITAAHVFNGRIYMGSFDTATGGTGGNAPVLTELSTMPSLPGFFAQADSDIVNLHAQFIAPVGTATGNSAPSYLMLDAIGDFAGRLYIANNGGIARAVNDPPDDCPAVGCPGWTNATPSAAAWSAKTSITVDKADLGLIEPRHRAIPGLVAFGGRLFAPRNTTAGPQLWSCNPAATGNNAHCDPGDWTLVAANSAGDTQLTQFNDANNSAIAMLAATSAHLYVGFNNANGARVYRTALAAASSRGDFTGQGGCTASAAGCAGIGGNGLGAGAKRLYDRRVFGSGAQEFLFLVAGDGASGPKVLRFAP